MHIEQVPPGYKLTEVGIIPSDWDVVKVSDVCDFIVPGRNKPKIFDGDIPWITTPDINDNDRVSQSKIDLCVSREEAKNIGSKIVPAGSVIMTCVGDLGITALTKNEIVINQQLHAFIPSSIIDRSFLFYVIGTRKNYINSIATKTAVPYLNKDNCNSIQIPLPPIEEQKRIAQVLSDIDELIRSLDELIIKKRNIKQGTMQLLLTGKQRLPGYSGEWEVKKLGDIFDISAGGDLVKHLFSNIKDKHFCYPIYSNSLSNKGLYGFCSYNNYESNCITVTARGTIGVANARYTKFTAIGRVLVLQPKIQLDNFFVSEYINDRIKFASETTGVPQLTAPQISKYEVLLPPLEEQKAIAQILSDMDEEIEVLEAKRNKYQDIKKGMMQELLTGKTRLV
jgi:type I restriction enzyme S subunit